MASGWEELLQRSRQQLSDVAGADADFPIVHRDLQQLHRDAERLKARSSRLDATAETNAATRLLAREGINAEQLSRDLRSFQLKANLEEAVPVEATSVEDYLTQVQEMAMLAAVQRAQKDAIADFDQRSLRWLQDDWQKEKRSLLQGLAALSSSSRALLPSSLPPSASSSSSLLPPSYGTLPSQPVNSKQAAYAAAVKALNAARESFAPFKVASSLLDAVRRSMGPVEDERQMRMTRCWAAVQCILGEDLSSSSASSSSSSGPSISSMLLGCRRHLETGHAQHMLRVIASSPMQASLGGATGNLQRVRAFLRVRLKDQVGQGVLDFDSDAASGGRPLVDTTWQQIYFCIRSGFFSEALHAAQSSRSSHSFAVMLSEWISTNGFVSSATAASAADECERLLRAAVRQPSMGGQGSRLSSSDRKKCLLLALIAARKPLAERVVRECSSLLSTLEDFIWFHLALIRPSDSQPAVDSGVWRLEDLQEYLGRFGADQYTKNGREPEMWGYVLLLTLQFEAAVTYLMQSVDPLDGLHIGIALEEGGAVQEARRQRKGQGRAVLDLAPNIRRYIGALIRGGEGGVAVEYLVLVARLMGDGPVRDEMLRELLHSRVGIQLLIGSGTSLEARAAAPLGRIVREAAGQRQVVLRAAKECEDAGLQDEALDLFEWCQAYAAALRLVNSRLSAAIAAVEVVPLSAAAAATLQEGPVSAAADLAALGRTLAERGQQTSERELMGREVAALQQLDVVLRIHVLAASSRWSEVLKDVQLLPPFRPMHPAGSPMESLSFAVQPRMAHVISVVLTAFRNLPSATGDPSLKTLHSKILNLVATSRGAYDQASGMLLSNP